MIDLKATGAKPRTIFGGLKNQWYGVGNDGNRFFFPTNTGAPLKRIMAVDVRRRRSMPATR